MHVINVMCNAEKDGGCDIILYLVEGLSTVISIELII